MESKLQIDHKMKSALSYENEGMLLHALQIYLFLTDEYPDFKDAYIKLAQLYERLGNLQSAINAFNSLFENNPDDVDSRVYFAQFLLKNSLWDDAINALNFVDSAKVPIAAFFIGYSHFMLNEFELSKLSFLNFISIERNSELTHQAYIYIAKIELKLNNFEIALEYAKKAEVLYANFWELNYIYAETYLNLEMYTHAAKAIEKAISLNPEESIIYQLAGKIYLKLEYYKKSEKNFLKFIELNEDVPSEVYSKLAETCFKSGKLIEAQAYYEIAIKINPTNEHAIFGKKNAEEFLNKDLVSGA